jgi:hypothetical protein
MKWHVLRIAPLSIALLRPLVRTTGRVTDFCHRVVGTPRRAVIAAIAVVVLLSARAAGPNAAPIRIVAARNAAPAVAGALHLSVCPPQTLPDGDACVHAPESDEGAPDMESSPNEHRDARGHWTAYDEIPRRPDRPAEYDAYRYPVPCERDCVVSGYDLDRPDDLQRRGRRLRTVGHGGVDLPQKKGTPIVLVPLEHQEGDADVVYVGPLFGTTVITHHVLREAGQLHDYVLLFAHLDAQAPGVRPGARLKEGNLVGFVGNTGSPELAHLHLEARRVRDGVDVGALAPSAMIASASSVVCDPRNVLPLKPSAASK